MANIAYIRVSAQDQNTDRQHEILKPYNIERTYEEKVSGKSAARTQLQEMMKYVRQGDVVYIESISRLARNTLDFLHITKELTDKGVGLVSVKEAIDTTTPTGQFMLTVFAALSQLERDTIKQRQAEGIAIAKAKGKRLGRPRIEITDEFKRVYSQWKEGKVKAVEAMKVLGMTHNTFYLRVKEYEGRK